MKKPVQFDIDGVLADFIAGFTTLAHEYFGTPILSDRTNLKYGTNHIVGADNSARVWKMIVDGTDFWWRLPAHADRPTFIRINNLQDERDVYFVTNRPGRWAKWQTESWLLAHGIWNPTVIVTDLKALPAQATGAGYAIEDKPGNAVMISYVNRAIRSFLIDLPYNRINHDMIGGRVERVNTLSEFLDIVEAGE